MSRGLVAPLQPTLWKPGLKGHTRKTRCVVCPAARQDLFHKFPRGMSPFSAGTTAELWGKGRNAEAATRPRPFCKVCSPHWDTLEVVPKTSLRMDFREREGCAPRPCCCWKRFQPPLPQARTSGGNSPTLQKPFTLPGVTLSFFGVLHPKFQGWAFSHALFGGMKLPDEEPPNFPAVFQRRWEAVAAQGERPVSNIWV